MGFLNASSVSVESLVSTRGGGLHVGQYATASVTQSVFDGNVGYYGGGLYISKESVNSVVRSCIITNNVAIISGGGAYLFSDVKAVSIVGTTISNNRAILSNGGGVFAHSNLRNINLLDEYTYDAAVLVESNHPY